MKKIIAILFVILFVLIILSATIGSVHVGFVSSFKIIASKVIPIDLSEIPASHIQIVQNLRLPRILLCALVGAGLAISGAIYQGVLKNSMADSYILGVSSRKRSRSNDCNYLRSIRC